MSVHMGNHAHSCLLEGICTATILKHQKSKQAYGSSYKILIIMFLHVIIKPIPSNLAFEKVQRQFNISLSPQVPGLKLGGRTSQKARVDSVASWPSINERASSGYLRCSEA